MKDKTQDLKKLMQRYPNHRIIFVYPGEGDENHFYLGSISSVTLDRFYYDVENDLEYLESDGHENFILEKIEETDWKNCICVRVN